MNLKRTTCLIAFAGTTLAMAADGPTSRPIDVGNLAVTYADTYANALAAPASDMLNVTYAAQNPVSSAVNTLVKPKFGIRAGLGETGATVFDLGLDLTFNVPIIPLPALRVDAQIWGSGLAFGGGHHGDALSLLGEENLAIGYIALGPSLYGTDVGGDHHSGIGIMGLVGMNLPAGLFVEGGLILGPSPLPLFITVGLRY